MPRFDVEFVNVQPHSCHRAAQFGASASLYVPDEAMQSACGVIYNQRETFASEIAASRALKLGQCHMLGFATEVQKLCQKEINSCRRLVCVQHLGCSNDLAGADGA